MAEIPHSRRAPICNSGGRRGISTTTRPIPTTPTPRCCWIQATRSLDHTPGQREIFRCPSDRTQALFNGSPVPRVRSVSMNREVGALVQCFDPPPILLFPQKVAELRDCSQQFIFIEEHPDSIGFVSFWVDDGIGPNAIIESYPAAYHERGANLSFADGHVEYHRWKDARTLPPVKFTKWLAGTASPDNPDVAWLQEKTCFSSTWGN